MTGSSFRLALSNGWTFSVSDEMRPFICNVAAWPTQDDPNSASDMRWFEWADGRTDVRCVSMGEVGLRLEEVVAAEPPVDREMQDMLDYTDELVAANPRIFARLAEND